MRKVLLTISKLALLVAVILMITFGTTFAVDGIMNPFTISDAAGGNITVKVSVWNERTMEITGVKAGYPTGDVGSKKVKFVIALCTTGNAEDVLEEDITIAYKTTDLTAVSVDRVDKDKIAGNEGKDCDYSPVSNTKTFTAGTKVKDCVYEVAVTVNEAEYGLFLANYTSSGSNAKLNIATSGITEREKTAYCARYFMFSVSVEKGNCRIHTVNGTQYDKAYGVVDVTYLLGYQKDSRTMASNNTAQDIYTLCVYNHSCSNNVSDITSMDNRKAKTSYYNISVHEFGKEVSANIIASGLGHWYFTGYGYIDGEDVWQDDSNAGLSYSNYAAEFKAEYSGSSSSWFWDSSNRYDQLNSMNNGVVTIELDGYPDEEKFDFQYWGNRGGMSPDEDDMEWSEDSYRFEYVTQDFAYYRVLGDPAGIGFSGYRYKHGEDRDLYDLTVLYNCDDDSPLTIEGMYIDSESLTVNDRLRIKVRFNEPVQIDTCFFKDNRYYNFTDRMPTINVAINGSSKPQYQLTFKYEQGIGTDTLVFYYDLKDLNYTEQISKLEVTGFSYGENICDFSASGKSFQKTSLKKNDSSDGVTTSSSFTSKFDNYTYKYAQYTVSINNTTYYRYSKWSLHETYAHNNEAKITIGTWSLPYSIDPRYPTLKESNGIVPDSTDIAKTHSAVVTFVNATLAKEVYFLWSDDMDGKTSTAITKPKSTEFYQKQSKSGSDYSKFTITSNALTGTRYLWLYIKTAFGRYSMALCGPFYFDNTADSVTNIALCNADGTEVPADTPTKVKYFKFTVPHTNDYRSSTITRRIDLLWATTSPWSSNTTINMNSKNADAPLYNIIRSSNPQIISSTTSPITVNALSFAVKSNVTIDDNVNADLSMSYTVDTNTGTWRTATYTQSTTYIVKLGYDESAEMNDFCLDAGTFIRSYIGFLTTDAVNNKKTYTDSSQYIAGKDYIDDESYYFDTRNVITPLNIDPTQDGYMFPKGKSITGMSWDYLSTNGVTDDSIKVFNSKAQSDTDPFKITLKINNSYLLATQFADNVSLNYQIVVKKPSTIYKTNQFDFSTGTGGSFRNRTYTSNYIFDPTAVQDTKWFTVTLGQSDPTGYPNNYDLITITFKTDAESVKDINGYYDISFNINQWNGSKYDVTTVKSTEFFFVSGEDNTHNLGVNSDSASVYDVFALKAGSKFYYLNSAGDPATENYVGDAESELMFSTETKAKEYLKYMEYQDLYVLKLNATQASYLSSGSNNYVKASVDRNKAPAANQYWIRYKSTDWDLADATTKTNWVYYYYGDTVDFAILDVGKLSEGLNQVITMVVNTIAKDLGSNKEYKTDDGMDINATNIRYKDLSCDTSKTSQTINPALVYTGDTEINKEVAQEKSATSIADGTVLINKVYRLYDKTTKSTASYYYMSEGGAVVKQNYTKNGGNLTTSSIDIMRDYLTFLEYQDMYLYKIESNDDAASLNQSSGNYIKASGETRTAKKGQYWIRYKASGWTDKSSSASESRFWVYYYYDDDSSITSININALSANIKSAIDTIVGNILKNYGNETMLVDGDDLDENGSPYISKDCIVPEPISATKTKSNTSFAADLSFGGDTEIYSSEIKVDEVAYLLVSNVTLKFNSYSNIYIRPLVGKYTNYFGKVTAGEDIIIKDVIDDVYKQIYITYEKEVHGITINPKDIEELVAPSGAYEILEVDDYGARRMYVYVDKTAPQINFVYKTFTQDGNLIEADDYKRDSKSIDKTINAAEFTLTGIGAVGVHTGATSEEEVDSFAYIIVYKQNLLYGTYTKDSFVNGKEYTLPDGKYTIKVYDRSGNYYTLTLRINSSLINVNISTEDNFAFNITNRTEDEIREFYVSFENDKSFDVVFAQKKSYEESGTYVIHIIDLYNNVYEKTVVFSRVLPTITWSYATDNRGNFSLVTKDTNCTVVEKITSRSYNVTTAVMVAFAYSASAGVSHEFVGEKPDVTESRYKNVSVAQNTIGNYKVKFYYTKFPDIYVIYNVIVDNAAPIIEVTYNQYSFEQQDAIDVVRQIKAQKAGYYDQDQVITPTRIDFTMTDFSTRQISSGAIITTLQANFGVTDESGVRRIVISKDGNLIYDGVYNEDGNYYVTKKDDEGNDVQEKIAFNNTFTEYGTFTIVAYDVLENKTTFTFTNTSSYDVTYYVDGEKIEPTISYVYKMNSLGQYVYDSKGNKIVESSWMFLKNFVQTNTDGDDVPESSKVDKDSVFRYIRNGQKYTKLEYGNSYQLIKLSESVNVVYLITDDTGKQYFVGFKFDKDTLTQFYYAVSKLENVVYAYKTDASGNFIVDDEGNYVIDEEATVITYTYSAYEKLADAPAIYLNNSAKSKANNEYVIYSIKDLGFTIVGYFDANGNIYLKANVLSDTTRTITVEAKVTSSSNLFEPAYYKTELSLKTTDVIVTSDGVEVDTSQSSGYEVIYTHGSKIDVDKDKIDKSMVVNVKVAFSDTFTFNKFYYLYTNDEKIPQSEIYQFNDGDGFYCITVENVYGNIKTYYFAVSNKLLVSSIATFIDGWTRDYPTSYDEKMYSNSTFEIQFEESNITYTVTRDGVVYKPSISRGAGSIILFFDEAGDYSILINDQYGNMIGKQFEIRYNEIDLSSDVLYGWNEKARLKDKGYTNTKISIDGDKIQASGIKFISITMGKDEKIIYDDISRTDVKVPYNAENLKEAVGQLGDGEYTITFRDKYGNIAKKVVTYRETPTLHLSRMTSASQSITEYSVEIALEYGLWSNSMIRFTTESINYYFEIDGAETRCEKRLNFTNETDGSIAYKVYYIDEYGNEYRFDANLYRTTIVVSVPESVHLVTINETNYTNDLVQITYEGVETFATYTFNETEDFDRYYLGQSLKRDGKYIFTVEDLAGNCTKYIIVKDSVVNFQITDNVEGKVVKNGFVSQRANLNFSAVNNDSVYIKQAFRNGFEYDNVDELSFSEDGKWELIIADKVGNETYFMFYIITHELNYLDYYAPQNYEISDVWMFTEAGRTTLNALIQVDENGVQHFEFANDGKYTVAMNSLITGVSTNFSFDISTVKPTAELDGCTVGEATINDIKLKGTVAGDKVYVYKDGKLVKTYTVAQDGESVEMSDEGDYRVVIENIAGNTVEYSFTRKHVANSAGSALLIILLIAVATGFFIGLLYRKRSKVDK